MAKYLQITRTQIRAMVYERLGQASNQFWRDDEINRYIQEALRVWNSLTGFWSEQVFLSTVANQPWYTLPGTITSATRLEWNGQPMSQASLWELDYGRPSWESDTTLVPDVPTQPKCWAPAGLTLIAIWPADATNANSLTVQGITATPILLTDAQFLDIGREELNHILDYIQHIATFKEGGVEFESSGRLLQNFLKGAATRNGMLLANEKYGPWMGQTREPMQRRRSLAQPHVGVR